MMANSIQGRQEWNNHDSLDLDLLDETFDNVNYLQNYDENDFQSLTDLDLSLLLPDTPPDTPDNESQTSNRSDHCSDTGISNPFSSPSSPSSSSNCSSTSGSCSEFFASPNSSISSQNIPLQNQQFVLQQQPPNLIVSPQNNTQQIVFTNGFTNYSTYQPFVQAIPVVQTQPQFSQSLLKTPSSFRPIACKPNIITCHQIQPQIITNPLPTPIEIVNKRNSVSENENETIRKMKIEERKKKNRIASTNSRMKQKDYLTKLESNVKDLVKECDSLRNENSRLKSRVQELESQLGFGHESSKDINDNYENYVSHNKTSKTKISLFAVLCFVCFQISPFFTSTQIKFDSNLSTSGNSPQNSRNTTAIQISSNFPVHHGRHLLWALNDKENVTTNYNSVKKYEESFHRLQNKLQNNSMNDSVVYRNSTIKCSDYFNVTESIRLENELRDLLTRLKYEEKNREDMKFLNRIRRQKNKKLLFDSKHVPIPKLKMWMSKQKYGNEFEDFNAENNFASSDGEDQNKQNYENLFGNIHRRDDTFYYLSYPSHGHLFLPPISNRTDIRPRFSFLIPSFNNLTIDDTFTNHTNKQQKHLNHSDSSSQMVLLQIDCQVINTKVTLIDSDSLLRQQQQQQQQSKGAKVKSRKAISPMSAGNVVGKLVNGNKDVSFNSSLLNNSSSSNIAK